MNKGLYTLLVTRIRLLTIGTIGIFFFFFIKSGILSANPKCIKKIGIEGSTHVFTGTCIQQKTKWDFEHWQLNKRRVYVFECDSIIKGDLKKKIKVVSGWAEVISSHGKGFRLNQKYVVYAFRKGLGKGTVHTNNCYLSEAIGENEELIIKHDKGNF